MGFFHRLFRTKAAPVAKRQGKSKRIIVRTKNRGRPTKEIRADGKITFRINKADKKQFEIACKRLELKTSFMLNNFCRTFIVETMRATSTADLNKIRDRIKRIENSD